MKKSIFALIFLLEVIGINAQPSNTTATESPKDNMTVIDFFQVNCLNKIWDIKWKAISEIDSCKYVLEYSKDQVNWIEYQTLEGTAHTTGSYNYATFMKRESDTLNYFRLKYDCTSTIEFYKNPVTNVCPDYLPDGDVTTPSFIVEYDNSDHSISINNTNFSNSKSTISVYSLMGQLIYNSEMMLSSISGKLNIPIASNSNEVLIVMVRNNNSSFTKKLIIP